MIKNDIDIRFSALDTGACPFCVKCDKCCVINSLKESIKKSISPRFDDVMEIVIYRCPEFEEKIEDNIS